MFACLLGEPRAEGLTRISPGDLGRLIGLDRAPEVTTVRRRIEELASMGRADALIDALARHHLSAHEEASGIFSVDGHVRAYHGGREVAKAHVARIRLSMPPSSTPGCATRTATGCSLGGHAGSVARG